MRNRTIITTSIIGGILSTALIAGGSFAFATEINDNQSPQQATHDCQSPEGSDPATGNGPNSSGKGQGADQGMKHGQGSSAGKAEGLLAGVESGTLTSEQEATLLYQAEEDKMSHDLYVKFGELYGDTVFDRVANAETKHLSAVQTLLERYDLDDPTAGTEIGVFSSEKVQELYDSFLEQGAVNRDGAYEAARAVEKGDIAGLTAAIDAVTAPDVLAVYEHLLSGSEHHLSAFNG